MTPESVRPATFRRYRQLVEVHLLPALGHLRLARVTSGDVERMLAEMVKSGRSRRTAHHARAVLRSALNKAMRHRLIGSNAAADADWRQPGAYRPTTLTAEQLDRLIRAFENEAIEPLVTVALATGMRQGELLGLRWSNVDFEKRTVAVNGALLRGQLVELKTSASRRLVPLLDFAAAALRRQKVRQNEQRLLAGSGWRPTAGMDDLVFTSSIGTPLDGTIVTKAFQAVLARAELPRLRFHDLRHHTATLLAAKGVHPKVIHEWLGHSTIAMTMNVYTHVMDDLRRDAADRLDGLFASL